MISKSRAQSKQYQQHSIFPNQQKQSYFAVVPQKYNTNASCHDATNPQLKQIIDKLIIKSRSLVTSLQKTLKQLDEVKIQKQFWKSHYIGFKTACEKYIKSRGLAPFEYIYDIENSLKQAILNQQKSLLESSYRSLSVNNFKRINPPFGGNSSWNKNEFSMDKGFQQVNLSKEFIEQQAKFIHSTFVKQPQQDQTNANKTIITFSSQLQNPRSCQKKGDSVKKRVFAGIRLGQGINKDKTLPASPIKVSIFEEKSKSRSFYRRKDSLQAKKITLSHTTKKKPPQQNTVQQQNP